MDLKDCHHLASASPPLSQSTAVPPAYWKLLCPGHDMAGPFSNVISERPSPILPSLSLPTSYHIMFYYLHGIYPHTKRLVYFLTFLSSPFRSWVSCGQRPSLSVLLSGACQGPIPPPDTWWVSCHLSCSGRVTEAAFRDTDFPCVLLPFPDNITDEGYLQICCFAQGSELGTWATEQNAAGLARKDSRKLERLRHKIVWKRNCHSKPNEVNLPSFRKEKKKRTFK